VLTRDHTDLPAIHTFIHEWNEPYLPFLPSSRVSSHFDQYSFPIPTKRLSWPMWLVKYRGAFVCPKMVTHPSS